MRWDRGRRSDNVEIDTGGGGPRFGGGRGLGLGGIVVLAILGLVFFKDPTALLGQADTGGTAPTASATPADSSDPQVDFVRAIQEFGLETVLVFAFYLQEKLLERNPTQEAIIILDLGQDDLENPPIGSLFEARAWVGAFLKFLQPFAAWADPFYAELYHRIFIVRAPSFFAASAVRALSIASLALPTSGSASL